MENLEKQVSKFVELLNSTITAAGGEAARIWPDMIRYWWLHAFTGFCSLFIMGAVAIYTSYWFYGKRPTYPESSVARDGCILMSVITSIGGSFFIFYACKFIPSLFYPEVGLVRSIIFP